MIHLLYCIFNSSKLRQPVRLAGVDDQPVSFLTVNGLGAAVSRISSSDCTTTLSRVLAYERVIECLHGELTVIPMRYGCLFHEAPKIAHLLETGRSRYTELLEELEGCVEMGIRVLPNYGERGSSESGEPHADGSSRDAQRTESGSAYLAARRHHYNQKDQLSLENRRIAERYQATFAGLFVKCKSESPARSDAVPALPPSLLSLHFLVKRPSVGAFRRLFQDIVAGKEEKALLSGPWPPYNFAAPDQSPLASFTT